MSVERLVLGTAALGLPYGLPPPGASAPVLIPDATAAALVAAAGAAGIRTFDTAPAYGAAEERLGRHLGSGAVVWTKIDHRLTTADDLVVRVPDSIAASFARLRRTRVDAIQWHNWTAALGADAGWCRAWDALADDPRVGMRGCSTYGVADALAAVASGRFQLLQVEGNLLNPTVLDALVEPARRAGVTVAVRSVFLQGVLSPKGGHLPQHLAALAPARARAEARAREVGLPLHHAALRAVLDHPVGAVALVGLDGADQLAEAVAAATRPPLPSATWADLAIDPALTDPRIWGRS